MKTCIKCGISKELNEYYLRGGKQTHLYKSACKECHRVRGNEYYHKTKTPDKQRKANLKRAFGISVEDYEVMLAKQNNCCAICGKHASKFSRRLAVDHCHTTGKIRSLLCMFCNTGLGKFEDSEELLNKAINYLKEHKDGN